MNRPKTKFQGIQDSTNTSTLGSNIPGHALKTVSLFTGCGGSDKGLIDAGCEILMAKRYSGLCQRGL